MGEELKEMEDGMLGGCIYRCSEGCLQLMTNVIISRDLGDDEVNVRRKS